MSLRKGKCDPCGPVAVRGASTGWLREIAAAVRKEMLITFRYPSWFISLLIWPILLPLGYIYGSKALAGPGKEGVARFAQLTGVIDYTGYLVLGSCLWMWANFTLWSTGNFLRTEKLRGTLESNWLTPAPRLSLLIGAGLADLVASFCTTMLSLLEFTLVFGLTFRGSLWVAVAILLFTIPSIYGLGILFASLVIYARKANSVVFVVRGVIMLFCGVSYPLAVLPGWMKTVAAWIPFTYALRSFRAVILSGAGFTTVSGDLIRLALWGLFLTAAGVWAFNAAERKSCQTGTLGQY